MTNWRTRFAPSPTGHLHLGHAYSALCAWHYAGGDPARFVLRIDDLDHTRCRPDYTAQIISDLHWLGISWAAAPIYQSHRLARYAEALAQLQEMGMIYPCYLSRAELGQILSAPHDDNIDATPSTRDLLSKAEKQHRDNTGQTPAWRLDMKKAIAHVGATHVGAALSWSDHNGQTHHATPEIFGDTVIARRDIQASYHLSVVLDDHDDGIELVVRGQDLFASTHLHRLLQALLDLPPPCYHHHRLICDEHGKRLAKRDQARALSTYRDQGISPDQLKKTLPIIGPIIGPTIE